MTNELGTLLKARRFLPLFLTQALGAFNDNLFKNAVTALVTYGLVLHTTIEASTMAALATGVFVAPFFLFSALAGQLADKLEKSTLIRWVKLAEIGVMTLAAVGLALHSAWFLLGVLFLMGTQSTFFGPLKLSILPQHLREDELVAGNGLIEAGTFLAILAGTMIGVMLAEMPGVVVVLSAMLIGFAVMGWLTSRAIPVAAASEPDLQVRANLAAETWNILKIAAENRQVLLTVFGISWFWLVGSVYLAQLQPFTKEIVGAEPGVISWFLGLFSVGVAVGSLLCNRVTQGHVTLMPVPVAALGMSIFGVDFYFATPSVPMGEAGGLVSLSEFLDRPEGWRMSIDL